MVIAFMFRPMILLEMIFVSLEFKIQNKLLEQFCFDLMVLKYKLAVFGLK